MGDAYRTYLDKKYPEVLEAFMSFGILFESEYYWVTAEYVDSSLF
jgi:predicted transcriptional regulator